MTRQSTPPHGPHGWPEAYPQPNPWTPPPGYPTPLQQPQPHPPKKKHTDLILGLSGIVFFVVIVLVAGFLVLANRNKAQTTASTDPTVTATYAGETSPWVGHLPDPCKDFPANVVKSVGLDPSTKYTNGSNRPHTVQMTCQYRSPIPNDLRADPAASWAVLIQYQTFSYGEVLANKSRDNYRPITVNGQPGTFFHIIGDDDPLRTRCDLSIGTTFGNVTFSGLDGFDMRLPYRELCARTLRVAKALQPYLPHDSAPK